MTAIAILIGVLYSAIIFLLFNLHLKIVMKGDGIKFNTLWIFLILIATMLLLGTHFFIFDFLFPSKSVEERMNAFLISAAIDFPIFLSLVGYFSFRIYKIKKQNGLIGGPENVF
jgi:hypothetical protein